MLIPFGNGKLAQKGRGFASQGNPENFFEPGAKRCSHLAMRATPGRQPWASRPEVFLDGTETKSEDCQRARGQTCSTPNFGSTGGNCGFSVTEPFTASRCVPRSVAGNVRYSSLA